ncbi:glycosyltransferase family 2 protein [Pedosphaera parvula]|uniref:Glycosyl transferase family 2 n=1 Tax=Pedosphaera parvula (strain Ellin514) TaxID=320771 RepID=B9XAA7_PEDPL|nr:glycosyltransferase family 2 protein [Pedosphaera parvula]EEF63448.1 glycosyl transferase family 2 [Pedosphaera parvula Ellin514]
MSSEQVALSIVIPVFNEAEMLPKLFQELGRVRAGTLRGEGPLEIVLVDDGSKDSSWNLISAQCQRDPAYIGVRFSRNFGHQVALAAGLETARGSVIVSMDADLQDPPDVILEMLAAHRQGYDVVYATRATRGTEPWGKRVSAKFFYYAIEKLSGVPIPRNTGDFRLMSRRSLMELMKLRESHRFLRGLVPWIGFPQTQIFYDRADRTGGETHYPWHKMMRLAIDGIASMSQAPLRLAYAVSLMLFAVFVGYILYAFIKHLVVGTELVPGWTSIMSAITIFGTIQLLLLGVFGEYLGRVYEQVKNRPLYVVQEIRRAAQEGNTTTTPNRNQTPLTPP